MASSELSAMLMAPMASRKMAAVCEHFVLLGRPLPAGINLFDPVSPQIILTAMATAAKAKKADELEQAAAENDDDDCRDGSERLEQNPMAYSDDATPEAVYIDLRQRLADDLSIVVSPAWRLDSIAGLDMLLTGLKTALAFKTNKAEKEAAERRDRQRGFMEDSTALAFDDSQTPDEQAARAKSYRDHRESMATARRVHSGRTVNRESVPFGGNRRG